MPGIATTRASIPLGGNGSDWASYWATRTPSNLVATVISSTQINLTWDDAAVAADGLKLYLSTDNGATYTYNSTIAFGVEAKNVTGLIAGTDYKFKLIAYKGAVESSGIYTWGKTLELWYLAGGVAAVNCKGAYQPIGAANLAASYTNLITPGTNDAFAGAAPTHDPALGWIFDGTSQYLKTGIVPENDQTWSMIVRYSEFTSGTDTIAGVYEGAANKEFRLTINSVGGNIVAGNGQGASNAPARASGIFAVVGNKMYFNGVEVLAVPSPIPAGSGAITYDIWIGQVHYSSDSGFFDGNVQALAIYDKVLSDAEVFAITTQMNLLGQTNATLRQNYVNRGFGSLICFDMASFRTSATEVGETNGNVDTFAPTGLDVDNWLDACVSAGMKYAILTTKHHAGFKMWNSASKVGANVVYGVQSTAWYAANGSPDITKLFVDGCRARGLKVGIYFSIWDLTWEAQTGNDQTTDPVGYIAMIEAELTELLTNYGTIDSVWFDGWSWHIGYANIPYATIYNFVKGIQANCVFVENAQTHPSVTSEIETYETTPEGPIPAGNIRLVEEVQSIRNDGFWFYHSDLDQDSSKLFTKVQELTKIGQVNGRNGTYLMGITPDTTGHLPAAQKTLLESLTT